jgi:hypothetical protein
MQHDTLSRPPNSAAQGERDAYNRAFSELGLEWYWDARTFDQLKTCAGDKHCVEAYIEAHRPHLLQAYDSGFLVAAIDSVRSRVSA